MNKPLTSVEINEIVAGLKKLSRNLWWMLGSGGAGFVPRAFAARLAESVSQRRGRVARGVGLRTARAPAGRRFCRPRPGRAAAISSVSRTTKHLGPPARARAAQKSRRVFFRRVRLPRIAADFRGRPGHSGRRPLPNPRATSASALSASDCFTAKVIFSRRLIRTTGRRNITIPWTRTMCRWNRCWTPTASGLICTRGNRHERRGFPGLARERGPRAGLPAGHQPAAERAAFTAI